MASLLGRLRHGLRKPQRGTIAVFVLVLSIRSLLYPDSLSPGAYKPWEPKRLAHESVVPKWNSSNPMSSSPLRPTTLLMDQKLSFPRQKSSLLRNQGEFTVPRVLVAIVGHINDNSGKELRMLHRQVISLWNSSRFCSLHEFENSRMECQVVYTFVVGGHNQSSSVPPILLDRSRPLVLKRIPVREDYDDVNMPDVTILNIRENMNDGKTPTLFYWASQTAKRLGIHYVATCDSDAFLRPNALLSVLHEDLPWGNSLRKRDASPPPTILGAIRNKVDWQQPLATDESFWEYEYFHGMHLYLAGQFYLMTVEVADSMVEGFRQNHTSQLAGPEDHDATTMIQVTTPHVPIRWLVVPLNHRFWRHPIKKSDEFRPYFENQAAKQKAGRVWVTPQVPRGFPKRRSLLVILGTEGDENRTQYRRALTSQSNVTICEVELEAGRSDECDLHYVFVVGDNPEAPTECIDNIDGLLLDDSMGPEGDLWRFNLSDNVHEGMGTSVLSFIEQRVDSFQERFDFILFIKSINMLEVSKWLEIEAVQSSAHNLLVGHVRDTKQRPRELDYVSYEKHWHHNYDGIHLYLGSHFFGISTTLVPGIVEQAKTNPEARSYFREVLGHDLTVLAYHIPRALLQWVPISKTMKFWKKTRRYLE